MMQRVCACATLHRGKTIIANPGNSNDDLAALSIAEQLGVAVQHTEQGTIEMWYKDNPTPVPTLNCNESGLAARLFVPIAALSGNEMTITGYGSLMKRPMTEYMDILPQLGVDISSGDGCLPITVKGPLHPKDITIDGSLSSQFLTGMLITYAFAATEPVTITVTELNSKPYVDLTLQVLQFFGREVQHDNYQAFTITPVNNDDAPDVYVHIEADWSAAANFVVANAMGNNADICNMNNDSLQADKVINDVVTPTNDAFDFDATNSPDLFPILAIYAAHCLGESSITGVHRLQHKESDRAESIMTMLDDLGVSYSIEEDALVVRSSKQPFKQGTIHSFNDHRIVMAAAIAALQADGPVTIEGAEAVSKSFPGFFDALIAAGVDCQLLN